MDKRLQKVRKRLYDNFPFYAKSALKIRTKEGQIQPFVLNDAQHPQLRLHAEGELLAHVHQTDLRRSRQASGGAGPR